MYIKINVELEPVNAERISTVLIWVDENDEQLR